MTAQAYSGNDNVSIRNICPWGEALASSFLPNGEIALAVTSTTAFHLIVSGGALGYSPAMSEALRFANFVTEADHMLLDQQRRKSKLDSQEAARTKTVELLKAQMSQAQTKREQNSVWTAFAEHQERELNELIAEELESLKTILLSGLSQRHAIDFNELRERRNASVVDSSVGPAPSRQLFEASVPPLSFFRRLFPTQRQKHEAKLKAAIAEYKREHREYQNRLTTARNNFEAAKAARNAAIDEFEKAYQEITLLAEITRRLESNPSGSKQPIFHVLISEDDLNERQVRIGQIEAIFAKRSPVFEEVAQEIDFRGSVRRN